ncbi:NAD(P)/FAD-dependent oxidoreductase [Phenylobacterium parvum]|uniref:Pyridine nucleotide-disulfide oxidoreductase n=1 Tax=Phenylobacterium parvum TaxID=2201350 RepID=A0A2Z3HV41_9CAUL|nr:FAD-dependent oxidoreductase [Phenylobacterium parvum]AWM78026.1 pyridine nucleotide-disulfide oxidoreductase [Phenylobacterium parvum]
MLRARVRVVLVGAGHAHLLVLKHAGALRAAGVEPILVAPPTFHYSGLATAVLSGALPPGRALLDVGALAARYGVRHLPAEVAAIDRQARRLHLSDGQDLAYDAVSFNIGSVTACGGDLQGEGEAWPVKPLSGLAGLRRRLEDHLADGVSPSIVVAGGGPTGFEVAAALAGRVERAGLSPRVLILRRSMPDWASARALGRLSAALQRRGILQTSGEAAGRRPGEVLLLDGGALPCDLLVMATGLQAPAVIADLGLPLSQDGRLAVGPTLQSPGDPTVLAVGDCAVITGSPRPPAGVFGVRAAPILAHNLAALGTGARLATFAPQSRWLSILDLGDGTGLALRGRVWSLGRGALMLKRRLDLGFVDGLRAASGEVLED